MKLDMTFEESNQRIDMTFAEIQTASDGGFERGYEQGYTEGNENGYKDGYSEAQEETASLFGIQNEVKGTGLVTLDYVNENEHNVEVKLSSDTVTDFSGVEVKCVKKNLCNAIRIIDKDNYIPLGSNLNYSLIWIPLPCAGEYTISWVNLNDVTPYIVKLFTSEQNYIKDMIAADSIHTSTVITVEENGFYLRMLNPYIADFLTYFGDFQIEMGNTKSNYEPYTEKTYTANADGTVDGVTSISPTMNIICEGVDISAKYYESQKAEWNRFWDKGQVYGTREDYSYCFRGAFWNDETFKPKYTPIYPTLIQYGFAESTITEFDSSLIDFNSDNNKTYVFYRASKLKRIIGTINLQNVTKYTGFFMQANSLESIEKVILPTTPLNNHIMFQQCPSLKRVDLEGEFLTTTSFQWSHELEVETAKNVIRCLKNYKGTDSDLANTITFYAGVWTLLDAEGNASPNGNTWKDYILDVGWNWA